MLAAERKATGGCNSEPQQPGKGASWQQGKVGAKNRRSLVELPHFQAGVPPPGSNTPAGETTLASRRVCELLGPCVGASPVAVVTHSFAHLTCASMGHSKNLAVLSPQGAR